MIYLLDTNILIYLIKNQPPTIAQKVNSLPTDAKLAMSFITWAELLKGAERSNCKPETLRRLDQLAQQIHVMYPEGPTICKHYAEQFMQLKDAGTPIRANDLWIACHALAEIATLAEPCQQFELHPTQIVEWKKRLLVNAAMHLDHIPKSRKRLI